jgi:O-antigen/teichoic acid export membrane protein
VVASGTAAPSTSSGSTGKFKLRGAGRRFGWGLADQAVSSLTNFAVSLYVARSLGAVQFGAFSLAYVTYSFALNASRGLSTDPLLVRFSGAELRVWRRAVGSCTGTALAVGLVAGAAMLAVAVLLGGTARVAFVAMGLTMPGLMLQDSWRFAFFALGRGSQAFLNDMIWAGAMLPGLLALRILGHETVFWFVLVWGAAANVAAAAGPLQARVVPRLLDAWAWVSQHRDLAFRYLAEESLGSVTGQVRAYGLAAIVGLAAVGSVQAASTLMGPFLMVLTGVSLVSVPEASRVLRQSPRHLRLFCLAMGGGLAAAALLWCGLLLVALPHGLGSFVLRGLWRPTERLVFPLTIAVMGACVSAGATAGLRALGVATRSLRAGIFGAATFIVGCLVGAWLDGAAGSVYGSALATTVSALVWWRQLQVALREADVASARLLGGQAGRHRMPDSPKVRPPSAAGARASPDHSSGFSLDENSA